MKTPICWKVNQEESDYKYTRWDFQNPNPKELIGLTGLYIYLERGYKVNGTKYEWLVHGTDILQEGTKQFFNKKKATMYIFAMMRKFNKANQMWLEAEK